MAGEQGAGNQADQEAELRRARDQVMGRIADAARRSGRDPAAVTLVAVSKTVAADRLRHALAAGLTLLGENRVQEAESKVDLLPGARWHLVGPLQSNKARRAVAIFEMIQSLDSADLARRLDRLSSEVHPGRPLPVLLQVNVDRDPAKAGFAPDDVESTLPELLGLPGLRIAGLMTIGRLVEEPDVARPAFQALRELSTDLRRRWPALGPELSMGMTDDYEVALSEGSTIVRVGRGLFGPRPVAGGVRH
jgi:pyridoxal phosphate enzyme (YggS family)